MVVLIILHVRSCFLSYFGGPRKDINMMRKLNKSDDFQLSHRIAGVQYVQVKLKLEWILTNEIHFYLFSVGVQQEKHILCLQPCGHNDYLPQRRN